jgi:hypothetical protein
MKMTFGIVAFHYPKDEYREEMIRRVTRAAKVMAAVPGCVEALCWQEKATGVVVATGKWETEEACVASFRAVVEADIDFNYDDRESRPREVFNLEAMGVMAIRGDRQADDGLPPPPGICHPFPFGKRLSLGGSDGNRHRLSDGRVHCYQWLPRSTAMAHDARPTVQE